MQEIKLFASKRFILKQETKSAYSYHCNRESLGTYRLMRYIWNWKFSEPSVILQFPTMGCNRHKTLSHTGLVQNWQLLTHLTFWLSTWIGWVSFLWTKGFPPEIISKSKFTYRKVGDIKKGMHLNRPWYSRGHLMGKLILTTDLTFV